MLYRLLPLTLVLLVSPVFAAPPARLDPEASRPYHWRVVLRFDPHPVFTPTFRGQIADAIKAGLQAPLGEVGRVEVIDLDSVPDEKREPLWKEFVKSGWPALEAPKFRELTGIKTHFLRITYNTSGYKLESRQHDGSTGLPSPVVRTKETRAPELVARTAGLMLGRDFGPVGTIEKLEKEPDAVRVRFRGGALPGFERFVEPGDIFAVSLIHEQAKQVPLPPGEKPRFGAKAPEPIRVALAQPQQFVLLRADGPVADGACKCQILTGYRKAFPTGRGILGSRCLKLATVEAPVELRVVDRQGQPQVGNQLLQVRATDSSFDAPLDARDGLELRAGVFRSPRPLRDVACVIVSLGSGRTVPFAVPVLGDGPVTIRFDAKPEDAARAALERDCEDLRGRVAEARSAQFELLKALTRLIIQGKNQEALARVTAGLASQDAAEKELTAELEKLQKDPGAKAEVPATLLASASKQLEAIRADRPRFAEKATELQTAAAKAADPVRFEREFRAKELESQIKSLISRGEVPEALDLYDELFKVTKNPEAQAQKEKLEKDWQPKDDTHRKARDFVTTEWRKMADLPAFKTAVPPLSEAAGALAKYEDKLGLRNLVSSFEPAYARMKEISDTLDPNSETDRAELQLLQDILTGVRKIEEDARAKLKELEAAVQPEKKP